MEKKIIMKEEKTGKYRRVQCYYGLGGKHFSVHRIVWEAFNGEIPKGYQIDHLDANPSNNALDNLALVTGSENCKKANHNQIKVIAKNKDEELHFNSLSDAWYRYLDIEVEADKFIKLLQNKNYIEDIIGIMKNNVHRLLCSESEKGSTQ